MVSTLGNVQIWLGTPPVVLHLMLVFFHLRQMPHWQDDRMFLTICLFEKS